MLDKTHISIKIPRKQQNSENIDKFIKKFKKMVDQEGILTEVRNRKYFKKPCIKKNEKSMKARHRKNRTKVY